MKLYGIFEQIQVTLGSS